MSIAFMPLEQLGPDFPHLSPRQIEILRAFPRYGQYKLVAQALGISIQTVKNHVTSILAALNCLSIGQAAVLWDQYERGWAPRWPSWPEFERRHRGERRAGERRHG